MKQQITIKIECGSNSHKAYNISRLIRGDYGIINSKINYEDTKKKITNNITLSFDLQNFERVGEVLNSLLELKIIGQDEIEEQED